MREIARVIRKICLLSETDRDAEAARVASTVLDPLIAAFREAHGAEALPDERLREIRTAERERAMDAAALGELLAPLLAEQLEHLSRGPGAAGRRREPSRSATSAPEIADLLDGMLRQQDAEPARPRPDRSAA